MKPLSTLSIVLALTLAMASQAAADELTLTISNGRVTIEARNVPVRRILEEWARVGQTKIINAEKVTGGPVSLSLVDIPESQALDTVLRSVGGYMAAPRAVPVADASLYDRVLVLASSTPPPVTAVRPAMPNPAARPGQTPFLQPPPQPAPVAELEPEVDDEDDAPTPATPNLGGQAAPYPGQQLTPVVPGQVPSQLTPLLPGTPAPDGRQGNPFGAQPGASVPGVIMQPPPADPRLQPSRPPVPPPPPPQTP